MFKSICSAKTTVVVIRSYKIRPLQPVQMLMRTYSGSQRRSRKVFRETASRARSDLAQLRRVLAESKRRRADGEPDQPARAYLKAIADDPEAVRALAVNHP